MDDNSSVPEFLTIEQLADRLRVSRATLFSWKQSADLVPGRHYLQRGRVLRFIWSAELPLVLFGGGFSPGAAEASIHAGAAVPRKAKADPVNWEY